MTSPILCIKIIKFENTINIKDKYWTQIFLDS